MILGRDAGRLSEELLQDLGRLVERLPKDDESSAPKRVIDGQRIIAICELSGLQLNLNGQRLLFYAENFYRKNQQKNYPFRTNRKISLVESDNDLFFNVRAFSLSPFLTLLRLSTELDFPIILARNLFVCEWIFGAGSEFSSISFNFSFGLYSLEPKIFSRILPSGSALMLNASITEQ